MISTVFIFMGVVTALAVLAVLAKTYTGTPKKAEKREKAEIMKQLLALSERENSMSAIASPPAKSFQRASRAATRGKDQMDAETEAQIRQRAYELYQARGGVGGSATDDWQQAKEEVLRSKAKAKAAKISP
jgi:hypothetical protein